MMKNIKFWMLFLIASFLFAPVAEAQFLLKLLNGIAEVQKEKKKAKYGNASNENQNSTVTIENGNSNPTPTAENEDSNLALTAESKDEIVLTVSADGVTKEEAIKVALRSAIEQAYGTFISANTTILNDELLKDEIVTVASGNIRGYKEIACEVMPSGTTFVTLQAKVSLSKLVGYAQSKGAETEFAGATFGMNMKLKELNKRNEKIALNNLLIQLKEVVPNSFKKELIIKEPKATSQSDMLNYFCTYSLYTKPGLKTTLKGYGYKEEIDENTKKLRESFLSNWLASSNDSYKVIANIKILPNENFINFVKLLNSTLQGLSLTKEECEEYASLNLKTSALCFQWNNYWPKELGRERRGKLQFRISQLELDEWGRQLNQILLEEFSNFKMVDNLGTKSYFNSYKLITEQDDPSFGSYRYYSYYDQEEDWHKMIQGTGLFKGALVKWNSYSFQDSKQRYGDETFFSFPYKYIEWEILFLIPKVEISKYSKFSIE